MGYTSTRDNYVYVVAWDADRIIKIGSTTKQRWRSFLIRGGRLVWLGLEGGVRFDTYPGEMDWQRAALEFADYAFGDRAAAQPYLGSGGGGWLECYRLGGRTADQFFSECTNRVLKHGAWALPPRIKPRLCSGKYHALDGLERTYADVLT